MLKKAHNGLQWKIFILVALCIILAGLGIKLYLKNNSDDRPSIILIIVDTLRPDHMSTYGYSVETTPFIDKLAKDSITFTEAISVSSSTLASLPSLMTSTYPSIHLMHIAGDIMPDYIKSIAQILKENGYYTGLIAAHLFPRWVFKNKDYNSIFVKPNGRASLLTEEAIRWIKKNRKNNFFLRIHYFDPHGPYDPPEEFREKYSNKGIYGDNSKNIAIMDRVRGLTSGIPPNGIPPYQLLGQNSDIGYYICQYDAEINYVDSQIGRLIKFLKEQGLYSKIILVLTADHGESLGEHNYYFNHGGYLYDALIRVPLIVKLSGNNPNNKSIPTQVSLIDVAPTLLDILKIKKDKIMQGGSFMELMYGKNLNFREYAFSEIYEGGSKVSVRTRDWKLIFSKDTDTYEFYSLKNDPQELTNIAESGDPEFPKFKKVLNDWMLQNVSKDKPRNFPLQEKEKRYLKSLGYLQ